MQEAFVGAWRARASFDPARGTPAAWLLAITRNRALDAVVRARRQDAVTPDVVSLAVFAGLSDREIATRLGLPPGLVRARIRDGLRRRRA